MAARVPASEHLSASPSSAAAELQEIRKSFGASPADLVAPRHTMTIKGRPTQVPAFPTRTQNAAHVCSGFFLEHPSFPSARIAAMAMFHVLFACHARAGRHCRELVHERQHVCKRFEVVVFASCVLPSLSPAVSKCLHTRSFFGVAPLIHGTCMGHKDMFARVTRGAP